MTKRFLPLLLAAFVFITLLNYSCTKLDTTSLGSDLIPAVDNINTFSDTFEIKTTQGIFDDSFKISRAENNVLGLINNDPVFGNTDARLFVQFKPGFYPYYFGNPGDTLVGVDSVVLGLSYKGVWGDTTQFQNLEIYEITDNTFGDSVFKFQNIKYQPTTGSLVGSGTIDLRTVAGKKIIANGRDSVTSQVRIKLSNAFRDVLFSRDSLAVSAGNNNAFRNDSLYRKSYKGLAVKSASGNALMYISLSDVTTRLEVFYRKRNAGKLDTTYTALRINNSDLGTNLPSATSNYISRNYPPAVINNVTALNPTVLYLQTGPGTYANLTIDNLTGLSNRIVHRASIYMEQDPVNQLTDSIFSAPPYMYLDLIDTGATKWKPIYFDLSPNTLYDPDTRAGFPYFPSDGAVDHNYFGGVARTRFNAIGQKVVYYDINITRHVQQIATKQTPNYRMRLYPAFRIFYPQYGGTAEIPYDNPPAFGRVKLKSGHHPDKRMRMQMVMVWSKI